MRSYDWLIAAGVIAGLAIAFALSGCAFYAVPVHTDESCAYTCEDRKSGYRQ